jgi:hypothetical protein
VIPTVCVAIGGGYIEDFALFFCGFAALQIYLGPNTRRVSCNSEYVRGLDIMERLCEGQAH